MKDGEIVGTGKISPNMDTVHGYSLIAGWVSVEIKELFQEAVPCWADFPTLSEEVEVGSFSAWPSNQLVALGVPGNIKYKMHVNLKCMHAVRVKKA